MEFAFSEQDSLDKVPEAFRGFYAPEPTVDGKYIVAENLAPAAQAIVGLNKALKAARNDAKTKAVDLTPLQEFGSTPAEIKEAIDNKINELMSQDENAKVNIEKIKQDLAKGYAQESEKTKTRAEALQNQLYEMLVKNEAVTAIAEAKGVPELLMPFISGQVKVTEEDGKFQACVVDSAGDIRYSGVTGQPMSIRELVAELKSNEKFGRAFESEAPKGGGMNPTSGKPTNTPKGDITATDKISQGLKKQFR